MRYYLLDEITPKDIDRLYSFLKDAATMSGLDRVFWVNIPDDCLSELQTSHLKCRPYYFAIELGEKMMKAEFYIRSLKGFNCTCSSLPDENQIRFIIRFVDGMIRELNIRT